MADFKEKTSEMDFGVQPRPGVIPDASSRNLHSLDRGEQAPKRVAGRGVGAAANALLAEVSLKGLDHLL